MTKFLHVVVLAGIPVLAASAPDPSVLVMDSTTLRFVTGPTNADAVLRSFLKTKGPTPLSYGIPNWDNLKIMPPFPRYQLERAAVWNSDSLNKATRDGYIYPVLQNDSECMNAAINKISGSDEADPTNIVLEMYGKVDPLTTVFDRYTDSFKKLSELEQLRGGLYETRLLMLPPGPPLSKSGPNTLFWLKSLKDSPDLLYPVQQRRLPKNIQPGRAYTPKEFFDLIYLNSP